MAYIPVSYYLTNNSKNLKVDKENKQIHRKIYIADW